jgi:hypothetical protein
MHGKSSLSFTGARGGAVSEESPEESSASAGASRAQEMSKNGKSLCKASDGQER